MVNYTLQDLTGSLFAVTIFPLVFVFPGYVVGWLLNVFDFRHRRWITKHLIGIVLSNATSPIILFLLYRFTSSIFAIGSLLFLGVLYLVLLIKENTTNVKASSLSLENYQKIAMSLVFAVTITVIALLVDIQVHNRLYYSTASYDLTTRVAVVDAITRTGVPPINPGYYPGYPVELTYLYYFWYILGSVIDRLGGNFITAYQAMIASIVWCTLALIATIAVYIRLRTPNDAKKGIRMSFIAAQLLLVSGLDFIPVITFSLESRFLFGRFPYDGRLEGWNTPIMSWMNAINWVPHHVASALACITAVMLFIYTKYGNLKQKLTTMFLIGMSLASAFGLSVWVPLTFALFWGVWLILIAFKKTERNHIWVMLGGGFLGLLFISPFLLEILQLGNGSPGSVFPVAFYVRPFMASSFLGLNSRIAYRFSNLLLLPLNYLFELGFFFVIALLWLRSQHDSPQETASYFKAETLLVASTTIFLTFFYSTIIVINDLGIRGWLPMQFILLIWAADLICRHTENGFLISPSIFKSFSSVQRSGSFLNFIFIVGVLTSSLELINIRFWPILIDTNIAGFPNELSPDIHLGERTFAARKTYDYIRANIPESSIIQSNPSTSIDRAGGLYGDHQMAIADRTAYGVSENELKRMTNGIGKIFNVDNVTDWEMLDKICNNYSIDIIIVNDTDQIWSSIVHLSAKRLPLYKNNYYAVFSCGEKLPN